jgi:L-alanine-DL-glutamate epimerase-like enolase superfamily enzyme
MRVASIELIPVNVPYVHREVSALVARDGVTGVIVRVETDDGIVGWGEASSGADVVSVEAALRAMTPFVIGRDPWNGEAMRADLYRYGLWQFRATTGNYAWPGIDMALWDICGKAAGEPLYRFFGGLRRSSVSYFYYLARGDAASLRDQCADGLSHGFDTFYLKTGLDPDEDTAMIATVRDALGPGPRLRLDANGAWSMPDAISMLRAVADYDIDFVEQPVRDHPVRQLAELRTRVPMAIAANEGLWTEADAYERIVSRQADVYCFSPYWTGSLAAFHRLAHVAALEGSQVCKHTHGELGLAATAAQHLLLTLPNIVEGHQQTAYMMTHDILTERIPISQEPTWGVPDGAGLGVDIDHEALREAADRYRREGRYLPYDPTLLASEERVLHSSAGRVDPAAVHPAGVSET